MSSASETTLPIADTTSISEPVRQVRTTDMRARGEPALWSLGGALAIGVIMIIGFLILVLWNGIVTFVPKPIAVVTSVDGTVTAGEPFRSEVFKLSPDILERLSGDWQQNLAANEGYAERTLYRIGNFDLYGEDFRWVVQFDVQDIAYPEDIVFVERLEWGPFVGTVETFSVDGQARDFESLADPEFESAHEAALERSELIAEIEHDEIGAINYELEESRLDLRKI